ncbi:hypothetical protein GCM10009122_40070 [Fulvivirga kasyanovii]
MQRFELAKEKVLNYLISRYGDKENYPVLQDDFVETSFGWVFFYNGCKFLKTGNPMYMYVGNGPVMYDVNLDKIILAGTGEPLEYYIKRYENDLKSNKF